MELIEKAIVFAAKAHDGQVRKGTNIPYISHPFAVGMYLKQADCSDEVIVAGILHDTIEDTITNYEDLVREFGSIVADLVQAASEPNKGLPWKERKLHTIKRLSRGTLEEIQITTADKLHNLRSIRQDYKIHGDAVWNRFNRGKEEQYWYYCCIVQVLLLRKSEFPLISELEKEVIAVFGSVGDFSN